MNAPKKMNKTRDKQRQTTINGNHTSRKKIQLVVLVAPSREAHTNDCVLSRQQEMKNWVKALLVKGRKGKLPLLVVKSNKAIVKYVGRYLYPTSLGVSLLVY